jgi:gluconate 2-dehydrogenase gamma chain
MHRFSRRSALKRAAVLGAATTVPVSAFAQGAQAEAYAHLSPLAARALEAIVARLIPNDENGPGALEAGAARYIDRALGDALAGLRSRYTDGLAAVDAYARATVGSDFADLDAEQQDGLLSEFEQNAATGFTPDSKSFFEQLLNHTIEGTFSDPSYGGNQDFIGWELVGYPGIRLAVGREQQAMNAELEPTRISAYDLPMFSGQDSEEGAQ